MPNFNTWERRQLDACVEDALRVPTQEIADLATLAGTVSTGVDDLPRGDLAGEELATRLALVDSAEDLAKRLEDVDLSVDVVDEIMRKLDDLGYLVIRKGP